WDAGNPAADMTGDGGVDGDDVIAFFGRWDSGC
ncbi:MAG: GC-type dockerin domain-anchored protein, partial [Phycisphaerales bacterium]